MAFDDMTLAGHDGDRELLVLIAEWRKTMKRGDDLYEEKERRLQEIYSRHPRPQSEIGRIFLKDGSTLPINAEDTGDDTGSPVSADAAAIIAERAIGRIIGSIIGGHLGKIQGFMIDPDRQARWAEEWRAYKAAIDEAEKAAQLDELERAAEAAYHDQAPPLLKRIKEMRPATLRGAIAMLEVLSEVQILSDDDLFESALVYLRSLAEREAR